MIDNSAPADALRAVIADLAAVPDPADRARAVAAVLDAVPGLQAELRAVRQAAVVELRATRSLAEVAAVLGISVPRVSQIASGISRSARHGAASPEEPEEDARPAGPAALAPPAGRDGVTFAEIAAHYGKSARYVAGDDRWGRHPEWPAPTGKRGRSLEYDPGAVAAFAAAHHTREAVPLDPDRLYTVGEIAAETGVRRVTVAADISRGRWPAPDEVGADGTKLWRGSTVAGHLAGRRGYRRSG
ncbi:hypothetical protein ACIPW5_12715 [Streptomyces sp. NPDC090077]|uniref:hypothetical protein n=1 Tax=Streptomyces sp. NPDC090077 TaxID=3365938 RepID=UPI00380DE439